MSADRERDDREDQPELEGRAAEADLRAAARAAAENEADGPHPPAEDLVAYQEGRLPDARADEVRAHLAACPECASLVLDYAAFPALEPPGGRELLDPEEVEAARRRFDAEHPPVVTPRAGGRGPGAYRLLALAATLAFVLALGWTLMQLRTIGELREEVAALREAAVTGGERLRVAGIVTWDLSSTYRGPEPRRVVAAEGSVGVLRFPAPETGAPWQATVRTGQGELVGSLPRVGPNADGDLVFVFDPPQTGRYRLELRSLDGGGTDVVEPFEVVRPEPGEDRPGGGDR